MLGPFALMSRLSPRRHVGGRTLQHGRGARALKQQGGCQIADHLEKRTGGRPPRQLRGGRASVPLALADARRGGRSQVQRLHRLRDVRFESAHPRIADIPLQRSEHSSSAKNGSEQLFQSAKHFRSL
jgi:hypothetical protein